MPRRSNAEAAQTRQSIIERAVRTASIEGLAGVTIGRLADDLGMSKAGVIGHFGNKADLQRAALRQAQQIFSEQVWEPARAKPAGLPRLLAICDAWVSHIADSPFPGGCFMCTVSTEWDARDGELREDVRSGWERWSEQLRRDAATARDQGDLPATTDPDQVAFDLMGIAMALNQSLQLLDDRRAVGRARRAMRRALARD
ncbi:MAG TPA: TetR/AcrR family transcriptional regulator [Thermoleophilaceae bacterium]|nr:TetR/AcrR family transcriptional regulator [Thermoleophilaceae bacterium]